MKYLCTLTELRSFLGNRNVYQCFVIIYCNISAMLNQLFSKDSQTAYLSGIATKQKRLKRSYRRRLHLRLYCFRGQVWYIW